MKKLQMTESKRKKNNKYVNKFIKSYIWFSSLDGDLIFMAIIDTLFLSVVKGLSASQITLFSTIPAAIGIVIQPYILKIIHKLGNTLSVRLSAICLLLSSIIITVGPTFSVLVLGKLFYEIAFVLKNMESIMLKNNLIYAKRKKEYISIRNKSTIAYAVITAIVAFVAGYVFNINPYLPMIINIIVCGICCVIAFSMRDVTKNDKIPEKKLKKASTGKMSIIAYVAILSYAFFYTAVSVGQSNGKLFIQYQLNDYFDTAKTATYFSMIIAISRIVRIISNVLFDKMYKVLKDKINIALCSTFIFAFVFIGIGSFIQDNLYLKFGLMASGFFIILAVRDPFKIYIQDLILRVSRPEEQQTLFAHLELARKIGTTLVGFAVSAALLKFSMVWIIIAAGVIALMTLKTTIRLFELVRRTSSLAKNI